MVRTNSVEVVPPLVDSYKWLRKGSLVDTESETRSASDGGFTSRDGSPQPPPSEVALALPDDEGEAVDSLRAIMAARLRSALNLVDEVALLPETRSNALTEGEDAESWTVREIANVRKKVNELQSALRETRSLGTAALATLGFGAHDAVARLPQLAGVLLRTTRTDTATSQLAELAVTNAARSALDQRRAVLCGLIESNSRLGTTESESGSQVVVVRCDTEERDHPLRAAGRGRGGASRAAPPVIGPTTPPLVHRQPPVAGSSNCEVPPAFVHLSAPLFEALPPAVNPGPGPPVVASAPQRGAVRHPRSSRVSSRSTFALPQSHVSRSFGVPTNVGWNVGRPRTFAGTSPSFGVPTKIAF